MNKARTIESFVCIAVLVAVLFVGVWQIKPAHAAILFENGFEEGQLNPSPGLWTSNSTSGTATLEVSNAYAYEGTYSMHVSVSDAGQEASAQKTVSAETSGYFGAYVNITTMTGDYTSAFVEILYVGSATSGASLGIKDIAGTYNWTGRSRDESTIVSATLATTGLHFIEVYWLKSGSGISKFWVDGVELTDIGDTFDSDFHAITSLGVGSLGSSGFNFAGYFDKAVFDSAYIAQDIAQNLTEGDGEASSWNYRISQNATSCYLINSTGAVLDNGDPAVMLTNAQMNASDDGGGSVFVYQDTYLTANQIVGRGAGLNPDQLNDVYVDLNGSTFKRTGSVANEAFLFLFNYGSGTINYTLCNGVFDADAKSYLAYIACFSHSRFENLTFQHGTKGGVNHITGHYNNWTNIYIYSWSEVQMEGVGFSVQDISYSNFNNITMDGNNYVYSRGGFIMGDWASNAYYSGSKFNNVTGLWVKNVYRDLLYLNSGAYGNRVYNNTFTNCTLENNWATQYTALKLRPAINNTFLDIIIRNVTSAVTTGTGMPPSEALGNCTGNYIQAQIYNNTVASLILTADGDDQEVSGNFFNLTVQNGKGTYFSQGTNSPIKNNVVYMNFTNCYGGIYLEQGLITQNTFYLNFVNVTGHSDIWHYSGWTEITDNIFNVYATSGNPNGLMDFVNGTQSNFVYYPYVGGGPVTVSVFIVSPTNTTYTSPTVPVELYATGGTIDTIWWNCKNGTSWIYGSNQTYTAPTSMTGFVDGASYTFYAWANNTLGEWDEETVMFTVLIIVVPYDWGSFWGDWWGIP